MLPAPGRQRKRAELTAWIDEAGDYSPLEAVEADLSSPLRSARIALGSVALQSLKLTTRLCPARVPGWNRRPKWRSVQAWTDVTGARRLVSQETMGRWRNGRRRGLKIPWGETPVWVRVPLAPPVPSSRSTQLHRPTQPFPQPAHPRAPLPFRSTLLTLIPWATQPSQNPKLTHSPEPANHLTAASTSDLLSFCLLRDFRTCSPGREASGLPTIGRLLHAHPAPPCGPEVMKSSRKCAFSVTIGPYFHV